jgi:hypothetical protein
MNKKPHKTCPINIFFEYHTDPGPTVTVTNLLECYKKQGYTTLVIEDDPNSSVRDIIEIQASISKKAHDEDALLGPIDRLIMDMLDNNIKMLRTAQKHNFNIVTADMPSEERAQLENIQGQEAVYPARSKSMVKYIDKACQNYGQGMIFVVGVFHNDVIPLLEKKGYTNINSFFAYNATSQKSAENDPVFRFSDKENQFYQDIINDNNIVRNLRDTYFPSGLKLINVEKENSTQTIIDYMGFACGISGDSLDSKEEL